MNKNDVIIYQDDNGITRVSVRFTDDDLWLTQAQITDLYQTSKSNISEHIKNILSDGELEEAAVVRKFRTTAADGKNYNTSHYNLDMIIALGYRVQSQVATRFRRWATERLHEYMQKGFSLDDDRLKQGGNRYFRELLQRIRDIRSSERNFYQQVTDIYATSIDYDPRSQLTKEFFSTVQNKLHFAEFQALERISMSMQDWINALDNQIIANKRKLLEGKGNISHKKAIEKAEKEFEIYRTREMKQLESDFDKAIKQITKNSQNN